MTFWTIHLFVLAGIAAVFLPAFIVGCFEKRAVRSFEAHPVLPDTPYLQAMAALAMARGLTFLCGGHHSKYRDTLFAALLMSPDKLILTICAEGTMLGLRSQKTILMSRFNDGSLLFTTDDIGTCELDPLTQRQILMNADFDEMLAKHVARLREKMAPWPFAPDSDWSTIDEMYRARCDRMVQRGLAHYTDANCEFMRLTVWGSFRVSILNGLQSIHRPVNFLRQFKPRPGRR
jgi:hypothetical protein